MVSVMLLNEMVQKVYEDHDVVVLPIPDISSVNYGRGVGYGIIEHVPPPNIGFISATSIRDRINDNDTSWKENVDASIHNLVEQYLTGGA